MRNNIPPSPRNDITDANLDDFHGAPSPIPIDPLPVTIDPHTIRTTMSSINDLHHPQLLLPTSSLGGALLLSSSVNNDNFANATESHRETLRLELLNENDRRAVATDASDHRRQVDGELVHSGNPPSNNSSCVSNSCRQRSTEVQPSYGYRNLVSALNEAIEISNWINDRMDQSAVTTTSTSSIDLHDGPEMQQHHQQPHNHLSRQQEVVQLQQLQQQQHIQQPRNNRRRNIPHRHHYQGSDGWNHQRTRNHDGDSQ